MFKMLKEMQLAKNNRFNWLIKEYQKLSSEIKELKILTEQRREIKEEICEIMGDDGTLIVGNLKLIKKTRTIAAHYVNETTYDALKIERDDVEKSS